MFTLPVLAALAVVAVVTSFISGIFGMAGGMLLIGFLLLFLPVPVAMVFHGVIQIAANGWRLDVAGDGAQRDDLETLAQQLGVAEQVSFLGFRADIPARMQSASLMLAPTPNEGLGLAVLEAMAAGLPVIAADAQARIMTIEGIDDAQVELVWDPAWNPANMSDEARLELGML